MRLIDADSVLERLSVFKDDPDAEESTHHFMYGIETAREVIESEPTIDAVPVVRCKNCWKLGYDNCPMDDYFDSHPKEPDFFCAAGEPEEMRPRSACGPDYCEIGGAGHGTDL